MLYINFMFLGIILFSSLLSSCITSSIKEDATNKYNGFWIKTNESYIEQNTLETEWLQGILIENKKVYLSSDDGCREKYFSHEIKTVSDSLYTSFDDNFLEDIKMHFSGSTLTIPKDNHKLYAKKYTLNEYSVPLSPISFCNNYKDPMISIEIISNNLNANVYWDINDTIIFNLAIAIENSTTYPLEDMALKAFNRIYIDNQYNKSFTFDVILKKDFNYKAYIPINKLASDKNVEEKKIVLTIGIYRDGNVIKQTKTYLIKLK